MVLRDGQRVMCRAVQEVTEMYLVTAILGWISASSTRSLLRRSGTRSCALKASARIHRARYIAYGWARRDYRT